ncbi:MAG TPA: hypothetical protein VMT67_13830, partial [Terriglobales bacterium]|nr:hypothetical protein [Terriglobales bacterium]
MPTLALSELIGAAVYDPSGTSPVGKVREVALLPQEDPNRVAAFVVKTKQGDRVLNIRAVESINGGVRADSLASDWSPYASGEGMFLLDRDLLDQQIIDVFGRKVVRVNDVDIHEESGHEHVVLKLSAVDVGARGAMRRLLRGVVPASTLRSMMERIPPKMIPWEFVDLIETDPARRVKLKISLDRLSKLHPADIADIVEELAPAEREAIFETIDEEVAAQTLEELDPKVQVEV